MITLSLSEKWKPPRKEKMRNGLTFSLLLQINWKLPAENKAEVEGFVLKFRRQDRQWKADINLPASQASYTINNLGGWHQSCESVMHLSCF